MKTTINLDDLATKIETLEDRKGRTVQAIRMQHLATEAVEIEAMQELTGKYPAVQAKRGLFILIEEQKRAVYAKCEHEGCKTESLTRTSDLHQCKTCSVHHQPRAAKGGTQGALLEALAKRLS